jgi:hypothetical protein
MYAVARDAFSAEIAALMSGRLDPLAVDVLLGGTPRRCDLGNFGPLNIRRTALES